MPNVTLSFTLPDEEQALKTALKAQQITFLLHELDQRLRGKLKHGWQPDETLDSVAEEIRREIRPLIWED